MVTGMQPYHAESTERLERMIRSRIAPPPAPDPCPEPLRRILDQGDGARPGAALPLGAGVRADLEAFRAGQPVAAMTEDWTPRAGRRSRGRRRRRDAAHVPPARSRNRRGDATTRTAPPRRNIGRANARSRSPNAQIYARPAQLRLRWR